MKLCSAVLTGDVDTAPYQAAKKGADQPDRDVIP